MKSSNLSSKRDVLEFLWDWAEERGSWAKLLVKEVLNAKEGLPGDTLDIIYRIFRKSIGLTENISDIVIDKPSTSFLAKKILLNKLSEIKGLNRLSTNSIINFSPNLTVIYGENGTGKSGFSRILKNIGYSYESETKLIPNIYSEEEQDITAKIEYTCDDVKNEYCWKPSEKNADLKNISVYNNSCVQISLSGNRSLIVTPLGFALFDIISRELENLNQKMIGEKNSLTVEYDWFQNFHDGTEYFKAIWNIENINNDVVDKLASFSDNDQKLLDDLQSDLDRMSKEVLEKEIADLTQQRNEINEIKKLIEKSSESFSMLQWNNLIEAINKKNELEKKGYQGLEDLLNKRDIELFGKLEFEQFIRSADTYINSMIDKNYPNSDGARCIYCNQLLQSDESVDLIEQYTKILKDSTRKDLEIQKAIITELKEKFKVNVSSITLHYPSYGYDEKKRSIQPAFITKYNNAFKALKNAIDGDRPENVAFQIDFDLLLQELQKKQSELDSELSGKNESLNDVEKARININTKICNLLDKKLFSSKKEDLLKLIKSNYILNLLNNNSNAFNTSSISSKTTKARKELIEQKFADTFLEELKHFRKNHIEIELDFGTRKGETNIKQYLQDHYSLPDILSEGEQKAISLAEFFTELSIDGSNSTVVLDDPVNSLDHHIIDETAKRLISFSKNRQTVIFTHSILLYNSLLYQIGLPQNKSMDKKFYHCKNQYDSCGVITDADEEINNSNYYFKKMKILVNNTPKDRPEEEVAAEGYGYLRSAIELTVEHDILKGTVKRYQKNIALSNFCKLSGAEIDKYKESLNNIFEKSCGFIIGHSNPTEVASSPDMNQFKVDFENYKVIREAFVS
ncbi:MAG: AAA family ATPase [Spirochaetes bacterium]|nr:AAA family ATPase [Spirochaetota bacterium]MBN2769699.1 AAA family ATPase [Spirochaetota bacterium]